MTQVIDPAAFVTRAQALASRAGIEMSTLGKKICKDGKVFERISEERVTVRQLRSLEAKLDAFERDFSKPDSSGPASRVRTPA